MKREDWVDQLWAAIDQAKDQPFSYGEQDCCLFSARVIDAMCDTDYAVKLASKYQNARTAALYLAKYESLREAVTEWLGEAKPPVFAQRGDVVLFMNEGREVVGICIGGHIAAVTKNGVKMFPIDSAIAIWKVE
jgi:hypothetical protein